MNPIKPSKIIKEISKELGIEENDVDIIITHYYKSIQKLMKEVTERRILVYNLGTFIVHPKRLEKKIDHVEKMIEKTYDKTDMRSFGIRANGQRLLENLYKVRNQINKEKENKLLIRKKRKDEFNSYLERKGENS